MQYAIFAVWSNNNKREKEWKITREVPLINATAPFKYITYLCTRHDRNERQSSQVVGRMPKTHSRKKKWWWQTNSTNNGKTRIKFMCHLHTLDLWRSIGFGFAHDIYVNQSLSVSLVNFHVHSCIAWLNCLQFILCFFLLLLLCRIFIIRCVCIYFNLLSVKK